MFYIINYPGEVVIRKERQTENKNPKEKAEEGETSTIKLN